MARRKATSAPVSGTSTPRGPPLKILMLHGYTQSGPLFRAKTRALEKNLQKAFAATGGVELLYPTAPIRLSPMDAPTLAPMPTSEPAPLSSTVMTLSGPSADAGGGEDRISTQMPQLGINENGTGQQDEEEIDAWAWWRRKGEQEPYLYEGIETGLAALADLLKREGPFDGVIGFSQGGAMAAILASILEPGRIEAFKAQEKEGGIPFPASFILSKHLGSPSSQSIPKTENGTAPKQSTLQLIHPPFKFVVSYSGFGAPHNTYYRAFYFPKIRTPFLHFLGSVDTVVEEKRSLRLVEACEVTEGRVIYHPGGHFLPGSQRQVVQALIGFIREIVFESEEKDGNANLKSKTNEESVHDMDVPF